MCVVFLASAGHAAGKLKIVAIGAKMGDAKQSYVSFFPAMRFGTEEINQQGGNIGKQVEIIELDNKNSALGSKLAAQKAVSDGVIGVIGAF